MQGGLTKRHRCRSRSREEHLLVDGAVGPARARIDDLPPHLPGHPPQEEMRKCRGACGGQNAGPGRVGVRRGGRPLSGVRRLDQQQLARATFTLNVTTGDIVSRFS